MPSTPPPKPSVPRALPALGLAAASIVLAVLLAYANSFRGPFVFDDLLAIPQNPTLDHLATALTPPTGKGATVQGRPILNLSFALNRALSGNDVGSYHAVNLLIHGLAALLLLGLVRRTLLRLGWNGPQALLAGWAAALLWAVHPLQTESVTYLVQRAESLMGLWYLLCLYGYARWVESGERPLRSPWLWIAFASCLLGMATKEVMVSAPVMLWLYDAVFESEGPGDALWRRWRVLGVFALSWIPLFVLVYASGDRGGTSGFAVGVSRWTYWGTEAVGLFTYLKLLVVPSPLVFDYGTPWATGVLGIAGAMCVWTVLVAACAVVVLGRGERLRRYAPLAFVGLFAAAILATTGVVPGNRQALAEHRMYLPSAALLSAAVCLAARRSLRSTGKAAAVLWVAAVGGVAGLFGAMTAGRNADYRSELALYADTVAKAPDNAFARYNYAHALDDAGRGVEAIPQYEAAARIAPERVDTHYNLANDDAAIGDSAGAEREYVRALRLKPDYALAHYNYGNLLRSLGRSAEAMAHYRAALAKYPDYVEARSNLGALLLEMGQTQEAETQLRAALALAPDDVETHYNLGMAYFVEGRREPAIAELRTVLRLKPGFEPAKQRLAQLGAP